MQRREPDLDFPSLHAQFNRVLSEDTPTYFKEDMVLAVARIKQSRAKKNTNFNCVVIGDYETENEELAEFLKALHENCDSIKEGSRFAILFEFKNTHWVAIDCQYANNQFQFFIIDAANFSPSLEEIILTIKQEIPGADITYLELTEETKIQRCYKECGNFALDILARLSTISNLYELINPLSSAPSNIFSFIYKDQMQENKLHRITLYDLPPELGCIMRNMHSITQLNKLTAEKPYMASSKKSLTAYFMARVSKSGQNIGIEIKRKSFKRKTLAYYKTLSNFDIKMLMIRNENFIDYLTGKIIEEDNAKQDEAVLVVSQAEGKDPYYELALTPGYVGQAMMEFFTSGFRLFFPRTESQERNMVVEAHSIQPKLNK